MGALFADIDMALLLCRSGFNVKFEDGRSSLYEVCSATRARLPIIPMMRVKDMLSSADGVVGNIKVVMLENNDVVGEADTRLRSTKASIRQACTYTYLYQLLNSQHACFFVTMHGVLAHTTSYSQSYLCQSCVSDFQKDALLIRAVI